MNRQRILLLSVVHPATDPRILYKIAPSLAIHHEVFCALPNARSNQQKSNIAFINLPYFRQLLSRLLFCHPVMLWKCLRIRPDLVHIFVPELIPAAFLFKWLGAKIIYEVQENLYKKFSIKQFNNGLVFRAIFRLFDHLARKSFFCVFTEDAYLQEYENLALPYAVIHNYASIPFMDEYGAREFPVNEKPEFFYAGVISMERCFDVLVTALSKLKTRYPDFRMHLFGPVRFQPGEAASLPGYAEIRPNLIFYGYTDQKRLLSYAKNAVAGIALLKPVADYPDSYTTKLFDYMALKLPVIASDFLLYRHVVEQSECGFCISPYDAGILYQKLLWLIQNPEKGAVMGRNGRKAAEIHYNWKQEEAILLSFYKTILEHSGGS
ncbi:glycosyltransferase family 4 protein [Dyadobacter flavalbus]|uniref:Glycosyltransferase family 4 protein n=1 Tax=Dyadobacter flavalbus TaxID=2579942 RepID=A0A5M8R0D2_9BACT|nr:glycosyltransferase [Dyadobacter flavalbus]KAA6440133.1 glycosyltransferase family 4 protein [Dyadobacter flavalbus]